MAATFSWAQFTGSSGNSTTFAGSTVMATSSNNSMSWDFETADQTGTSNYTAAPVSAGSASWPVWLKGYWTNGGAFTVNNLKFWQFVPASSAAATASFTVFGKEQAAYSIATGTATGTQYASNVSLPIGTASTASPTNALTALGSFGTNAAGSGINGSYVSLQLSAAAAAPAGTSGYFGFTLQYDLLKIGRIKTSLYRWTPKFVN
jgi:hypothetical protein